MSKKTVQCPECQCNNVVLSSNQHKSATCRIISTVLTATLILILVIMAIQIIDAIRITTLINSETGEISYKYLFAGSSRNVPFGSFIETLPVILLVINASSYLYRMRTYLDA